MGLSGVVAFLFVIEPSAYLTDPGRARRYAVSVGLVPSTRAADAPRAFRPPCWFPIAVRRRTARLAGTSGARVRE